MACFNNDCRDAGKCVAAPNSGCRASIVFDAPRFSANALASAIREMVKADIQGDGERYTMHETIMREQLSAIERALAATTEPKP